MNDIEGLGALYKETYCLGDNADCARYMVFKKLGKPSVPHSLYPNMYARVNKILGVQ